MPTLALCLLISAKRSEAAIDDAGDVFPVRDVIDFGRGMTHFLVKLTPYS